MIKVSKTTVASRVLIFLLNGFPIFLSIIYLLFSSPDLTSVIVCIAIVLLTLFISWHIACNDYDIWVDANSGIVMLKKGTKENKFSYEDFLKFELQFKGAFMTTIYKYYGLRFSGKTYRIRYYIDKVGSPFAFLESEKETKLVEDELRGKLKSIFLK